MLGTEQPSSQPRLVPPVGTGERAPAAPGWPPGGRRCDGQRAFALVEIIAVLAIIVLLAALSLPAFTSLGRARKLVSAGNDFADLADLARQNSLAKNCLTALVLLTDAEPAGTNQAFGLLQRLPGATAAAANWQQITGWHTFAPGVCVDVALPASNAQPIDASCTFQDSAAQSAAAATCLPATFSYQGNTVSTYKFAIFLANGSLLNGNPERVELLEGFLTASSANANGAASSAAVYTHPLAKTTTTTQVTPADYYRITLLPATGRLKVDRP